MRNGSNIDRSSATIRYMTIPLMLFAAIGTSCGTTAAPAAAVIEDILNGDRHYGPESLKHDSIHEDVSSSLKGETNIGSTRSLRGPQTIPVSTDEIRDKKRTVRRNLGDFQELNDILALSKFRLPDAEWEVDVPWPLSSVDISMEDISCQDISVSDINVSYERESDQKMTFRATITDMDMNCVFNWSYGYSGGGWTGWVGGSGTGRVDSRNSYIHVVVGFASEDLDTAGPEGVSHQSCDTNVDIEDMSFDGGISGAVADTFEWTVREKLAEEVRDVTCQKFNEFATDGGMDEILDDVGEMFEVYLGDDLGIVDPLSPQDALVVSEGVNLLDFSDDTDAGMIGALLISLLEQFDDNLGSVSEDPILSTQELGINVMLKSTLLDDDMIYTISMDDSSDSVLYQGHDKLTETTITMTSIRISGLDSFYQVDPLNTIAANTLQKRFKLNTLEFEIDLRIVILPSSKTDSIVDSQILEIVEFVTVKLGAKDIDVTLSILMAIDKDKLNALTLATFFVTENVIPCVMTSLYAVEFSQLELEAGFIDSPTFVDGFIADGIDRVVTTSGEAFLEMYGGVIKKAMPNFFNVAGRDVVNGMLNEYVTSSRGDGVCGVDRRKL